MLPTQTVRTDSARSVTSSGGFAVVDLASNDSFGEWQEELEDETVVYEDLEQYRRQASVPRGPHPLEKYSDAQLEKLLITQPESIGPASLGRTSAGALYGGRAMPEGDNWTIVNPKETWGTPETIAYLTKTINHVNELFPNTPPLHIGDISRRDGGHIAPHVSHQSGRDVDLGFYYSSDKKWYSRANARNLDLPRTWAFVKTTITQTDVQMIFLDQSIQRLLREYAESIGEDIEWLDSVFGGPSSDLRPLVLHEPGHKTHLHVRYYNPIAEETGRRIYPALIKHKKLSPPTYYVKYKAKRGDSLRKLARKFKTTVSALKKANRLRSARIYAKRVYRIPKRGGVARITTPVSIPDRRLPPAPDLPAVHASSVMTAR